MKKIAIRSVLTVLILMFAIALSSCGLLGKSPEKAVEQVPTPTTENSVGTPEPTAPTETTSEVTPPTEASKPGIPEVEAPLPPPNITQMELILDDSGSMAGLVEGKAKIDVAKDSLAKIIDELKTKDNLEASLRVYGHQNKECTNSVVEIPMGKIDADAMKAKITNLKPLGYTPIYYSLTESVKDFKKDIPGDKIVVLVTDGLESCNGDPCAAAKALRDGGVVSKIHVVGFGLTKTELETLKCIAEPSGGLVVGANNATEFLGAMQEIMNKALSFNLKLNGVTKNGEKVFMKVKVLQNGKEVAQGQGAEVQFTLPAGTYDAEAESIEGMGTSVVKGVAVTEDKATEKDIQFSKAVIKVNVVGADGKPLSAKTLCVYPSGQTAKETKCAGTFAEKYDFKLQPGSYDLRAVSAATGDEAWVKGIVLKDGDEVQKTVSFAQGSIKVNVIGADGKPLISKNLCVYRPNETKEVKCAGTFTDNFEFKLTPGIYDLRLKSFGTSEGKEFKGIEVKALEVVSKIVTFEQGTLVVTVTDASGKKLDPVYTICAYPQGETKKEAGCAGTFTNTFKFTLKPGVYDLKAKNYKTQEEKWAKGVKVEAAKETSQNIVY